MHSRPSVAWIGLGHIGLPMAQRVQAAGFGLAVWARRREAAAPVVDAGAPWFADPAALVRHSDIVCTCVGGPDDVHELHESLMPFARPGTLFVDLSTAAPGTAVESARRASSLGLQVLDAPVTGGVAGAARGMLTALVGGEPAALERARPVLASFCQRIVACGSAGSGYRVKLINQTLVAGVLLGLADAAMLARAAGIDAVELKDALGGGTAASFLFESYLPRMMSGDGPATFTLGLLRKDLRLARAEALECGARTLLVDTALSAIDGACRRFGDAAGVQMLAAS